MIKKKSLKATSVRQKETGPFYSLPPKLQILIRSYLAKGDFRTAKILYDNELEANRATDV